MGARPAERLIAIDLDGTLLSPEREISPQDVQAVRRARQRGLGVVIASARPIFGMQAYLDQLGLSGPAITYNGAYVLDVPGERVYIDRPIRREDVHAVVRIVRQLGLYAGYYVAKAWYVDAERDEMYWEINAHKTYPTITDLSGDSVPLAHKFIVADLVDADRLTHGFEAISAALPGLNIHYSGQHSFEVTHAEAGKGRALAHLATALGYAPEQVVAIGDNFNDLDMFSFAGLSVAMGNAPAGVQAQADWVVASNRESGVAQALNRLLDSQE